MLTVYFDQNCMNARGADAELVRVDALAAAGKIQLVANPRNHIELKRGAYAALAERRLATVAMGLEGFRLDVSRLDEAVLAGPGFLNARDAFEIIFPNERIEEATNSIHDVMHIANADDFGADVFLTREKAILRARDELALRVRILSPAELLGEIEGSNA